MHLVYEIRCLSDFIIWLFSHLVQPVFLLLTEFSGEIEDPLYSQYLIPLFNWQFRALSADVSFMTRSGELLICFVFTADDAVVPSVLSHFFQSLRKRSLV